MLPPGREQRGRAWGVAGEEVWSSPSVQCGSPSGRGRPHPSPALPQSVLCSNVLPLYGRAPGSRSVPRVRAALGPVSSGDCTVPRGSPRPTDRRPGLDLRRRGPGPGFPRPYRFGSESLPQCCGPRTRTEGPPSSGSLADLTNTAHSRDLRCEAGRRPPRRDHSVERPERRARGLLGNTPRPLR